MDLLTGILNSNAAIKTPDAFGSFSRGQKNQQDIYKAELEKYKTQSDINAKQIENEKARYAQDQEYRMKHAIQESIKENGQLDVDILPRKAAEYGVAREGIDYMIKTLPAQFESIKKTALERRQIDVLTPGTSQGIKRVETEQTQPKTKVEQKSNLSPAVPVTEKEQSKTMWGVAATGDLGNIGSSKDSKMTEESYTKMPKETREDLVRGLNQQGYTFPSSATNADITKAIQEVQDNRYKTKEAEAFKGTSEAIPGQMIAVAGSRPTIDAATVEDLIKAGREYKTTKLGNKSTELGMVATKQGITEKEQKQEVVRQLKSEGYNATVDNVAKIQELQGQQNTIDKNIKHLETLKEKLISGKLSDDEFNNELKNMSNAIQSAEKVGTETQREELFKAIRPIPSLGSVFQASHSVQDLLANLGKSKIATQDRDEVLKLMETLMVNIKDAGIVSGALDAYKTKEKPKTNKTNAPREKTGEKKETSLERARRLRGGK